MANLNLSEFTEKLFVADADHTFIWDSAASISKRVSRNSWLSAGSIATSTPLTISQTWTDAAVAFAAMKIVATDTNSAAGSDFLELYSGTATQPLRLDIQKTGQLNIYGTWSNSTSYERLSFIAPTAANAIIGTNKGSGGGTARGLDLHTDGAARMTITTAGNVGIGTTAPGSTLTVAGTLHFGSNNGALIGGTSYGGHLGSTQYFGLRSTSAVSTTIYLQNNSSGDKNAVIRILGSGSGADHGALDINTIESSPILFTTGLSNERMRITAAGNVGIGTTSPTSKLHVVGDAVLTGQLLGSDYTVGTVATATQNNVAITNNHTGQTDSAFVITPKGAGSFIAGPKPDGTATGGNARGNYSVDLQRVRSLATQVASGANSFIGGGDNNSSLQGGAVICGGTTNTVNASLGTIVGGTANSCVGFAGFIGSGEQNSLTRSYTSISGGFQALADRYGIRAQAAGRFAATGDAQATKAVLRNKTTTNSAVELFLNGSSDRYTITSGKIISMLINITGTKSDGSAVAHYVRQYSIKNIGGTTSQVYAAVTVGTDNAAGTSIAISADDANDSLKIEVTGVASETWRWVASVDAVEVGHGT